MHQNAKKNPKQVPMPEGFKMFNAKDMKAQSVSGSTTKNGTK
jgi:hypothetical protein